MHLNNGHGVIKMSDGYRHRKPCSFAIFTNQVQTNQVLAINATNI